MFICGEKLGHLPVKYKIFVFRKRLCDDVLIFRAVNRARAVHQFTVLFHIAHGCFKYIILQIAQFVKILFPPLNIGLPGYHAESRTRNMFGLPHRRLACILCFLRPADLRFAESVPVGADECNTQ